MIDVVGSLEKITIEESDSKSAADTSDRSQGSTKPDKPLYRNPSDIPSYDQIEVIEVAHVHASSNDDSIVTIDEFAAELDVSNNPSQSLNASVLTNQL